MKKNAVQFVALIALLCSAHSAWAGLIKAYVSGFVVTGVQNKDEMKTGLQTLLMSRLAGDAILVVDSPAGADVTVSGNYVVFGKVFSIDAIAKNSAGNVLARAFVQGDSQDELIPAVGKLAKALADDLMKPVAPPSSSPPALAAVPEEKKAAPDLVRKDTVPAGAPDIVRPPSIDRSAGSGWVSQRIAGAMSGIAEGRTFANGDREIFLTGDRSLRYYHLGKELKLVFETSFDVGTRILSVDTADLDGDGMPEVYLTVLTGDTLASQVWVPADTTLKKVAEKLPYFFRGIALDGKEKKIFAQEKSSSGEFYGDVYELAKSGDSFTLKNPMKLPRFGYLYNFNRFTGPQGKSYFALLNPDGYLIVYSPEREQLWRSSDKFGGSELYFQRPGPVTAEAYTRMVFFDQRIIVTRDGEVIVPQNAGFWVIGTNRAYSKNSVFAFVWNGASLEEKWHTRQSQNYLADFAYDEHAKELLLLEVVQKEGLVEKGASALVIKKVE